MLSRDDFSLMTTVQSWLSGPTAAAKKTDFEVVATNVWKNTPSRPPESRPFSRSNLMRSSFLTMVKPFVDERVPASLTLRRCELSTDGVEALMKTLLANLSRV
jgi:hypothetical protein